MGLIKSTKALETLPFRTPDTGKWSFRLFELPTEADTGFCWYRPGCAAWTVPRSREPARFNGSNASCARARCFCRERGGEREGENEGEKGLITMRVLQGYLARKK